MIITLEISYYPLADNYTGIIDRFIDEISVEEITVEVGKMSTVLIGKYDKVMEVLTRSMRDVMADYLSVFNLKISNSCPIE